VFELIQAIKKLSATFWPSDVDEFHRIHLNVVISMLKYPHFNSKMNSLKEICKLIENTRNINNCNSILIGDEYLSGWLIDNRILSLAVEGESANKFWKLELCLNSFHIQFLIKATLIKVNIVRK